MAFLFFISPAGSGLAPQFIQYRGTGRFGNHLFLLTALVGIRIQLCIQKNQSCGFVPQLLLIGEGLAQLSAFAASCWWYQK